MFSAFVSITKYVADPQDTLPAITFWLMGSLSGTTFDTLKAGAPLIILGTLTIVLMRWRLNGGGSYIDGVNIKSMKHRQLWRKIGYVLQAKVTTFTYSVLDMVLLGRAAHLKMLEQPDAQDEEIALRSLEQVGILHLKDKLCNRISTGAPKRSGA